MIIAIGIRPKVGKDTVGKLIKRRCGFPVMHISGKVYASCCTLFKIKYTDYRAKPDETFCYHMFGKTANQILREYAEKVSEIAPKLYDYLTEELCGTHNDIIIADLMRKSEAEIVRSHGGILVNVIRHKEDLQIANTMYGIKWDYVIDNTGSFDDLRKKVDEFIDTFGLVKTTTIYK